MHSPQCQDHTLHKMIPRVLLNNIQYIKKFVLVSLCFYLVEHIPSVERVQQIKELKELKENISKSVFIKETNNLSIENRSASVNVEMRTIDKTKESKLILLWTEYQMIGKDIYDTIFSRISNKECPVSNCRFTTDRSLQNQSSAIIFHMPNLHWENYTYPQYRSIYFVCISDLDLFKHLVKVQFTILFMQGPKQAMDFYDL